jgi:hypothetical protein
MLITVSNSEKSAFTNCYNEQAGYPNSVLFVEKLSVTSHFWMGTQTRNIRALGSYPKHPQRTAPEWGP